ncbi:DUF1059 domain-containing protein [Patescibacteria group bacterium]
MKTMTCKQLGGSCDMKFHADTFEEIAELSKKHGMKMAEIADEDHLKAMGEMKAMMNVPGAMEKWFEEKKQKFNSIPENT